MLIFTELGTPFTQLLGTSMRFTEVLPTRKLGTERERDHLRSPPPTPSHLHSLSTTSSISSPSSVPTADWERLTLMTDPLMLRQPSTTTRSAPSASRFSEAPSVTASSPKGENEEEQRMRKEDNHLLSYSLSHRLLHLLFLPNTTTTTHLLEYMHSLLLLPPPTPLPQLLTYH